MTEINTWLAQATAERLERMAVHACAFADELEDVAIGLEAFGIEPSDYESFEDHPLVALVNALCERERGDEMLYLTTDQQELLGEAAQCLRALE